jgi:hypothetical protein
MNNRIAILNNNKMSSVITYDMDFVFQLKYKVNRELPVKTMKALNISTKIRAVMNEKDLKIFNRKLDNFDAPTLKKKINSLLNKLASSNIDGIFQKVSEILKNRKVLIEYTIRKLLTYTLEMPMLVDTYAEFYKRLYSQKTEQIFQETIAESLKLLNGTVDSQKINAAEDYGKFLDYLADKSKFTTIYYLFAELYKMNILKEKQLFEQIKTLENTILNSTPEQNDKYCECYVKLLHKLHDKKHINVDKIKEIISAKVVSMRIKFALYDIQDLYKCNFCSKCKNCIRLQKAKK